MCFYSDSCMLLFVLVSYVLIICGVVNFNVKVIVIQNGYKIYEFIVLLGEFVIDDFSFLGFGSELVIIIEEVDGFKCLFI